MVGSVLVAEIMLNSDLSMPYLVTFFFSSRRRHTRSLCDWSSDVCSSDLFHTGGVAAGVDITAGLPRVEELFEARIPKGKAEISHIDGIVEIVRGDGPTKVKVISREVYDTSLSLGKDAELLAAPGDAVALGQVVARVEADGVTS